MPLSKLEGWKTAALKCCDGKFTARVDFPLFLL